ETEPLRDAVVLVHDVVAGAQVGEARERAAGRRRRGRCTPAEDLRIGKERDAEVAPDEAATRGRDDELEPAADLHPAEQVLLPFRLAAMREGNEHVEALAQERAELVLGLAEPARRERRAL